MRSFLSFLAIFFLLASSVLAIEAYPVTFITNSPEGVPQSMSLMVYKQNFPGPVGSYMTGSDGTLQKEMVVGAYYISIVCSNPATPSLTSRIFKELEIINGPQTFEMSCAESDYARHVTLSATIDGSSQFND